MGGTLVQVFKSPMRVRILELLAQNTALPPEAEPLTDALRKFYPDATQQQVSYHLNVLTEAKMLPMRG